MQNPPPPPPPSSGPPPMGPPGQPPMMPPGGGGMYPPAGGGAMAVPGNLASPWLRIVGGLIDVIILGVISGLLGRLFGNASSYASTAIGLVLTIVYFGYFLSSRGQSVGMMPFGFKVRDQTTGQYPDMGKAALRGFIWYLEWIFTICIVGIVGWAWQIWDPQKQAIHDKVAGTIVTTN